jgi:hypothetical protein
MPNSNEEYEFARKIIKRESKNPNVYSKNRREAVLERIAKDSGLGEKAVKEIYKEFKKDYDKDWSKR